MGLVFARGAFAVSNVLRWERQKSPSLDLTNGHVSVGEEGVELFHKVFANKVGKVDLVKGVAQNGKENLLQIKIVRRIQILNGDCGQYPAEAAVPTIYVFKERHENLPSRC